MNFIFDLYGTLIDVWTDEGRAELWEGVGALIGDGEECAEAVRAEYLSLCRAAVQGEYHEINLLSVFEDMLSRRGVTPAVAPALASEFRRMSMVRLSAFDGVRDMLAELKATGAGVYLLSNAQSCFTIDELHATGLYELFDGIVISSDVGVKKPSAEIFAAAFHKFGIRAENSIYVGNDMRDDILGASGAGMKTVYIHTAQSGSYPNMEIPKPTYSVKTHTELASLLLSLDKGGVK